MGEMYGSSPYCGHIISLEWFTDPQSQVALKEIDREGNRVISYAVICKDCLEFFHECGDVLYTETDIGEWLGQL